jgi:tRNA A37 threonylcarbamoyladenosine synthetase subunit TsaC/SUA5/YrdC
MLGDAVAVYLDGGAAGAGYENHGGADSSSTIVDATALAAGVGPLRILRHGVITEEQLRAVVGDQLAANDTAAGETTT